MKNLSYSTKIVAKNIFLPSFQQTSTKCWIRSLCQYL